MAGEHEAREKGCLSSAEVSVLATRYHLSPDSVRVIEARVRAARDAEWVARIEGMRKPPFIIREAYDSGLDAEDVMAAEGRHEGFNAALDALLAAPREGTET